MRRSFKILLTSLVGLLLATMMLWLSAAYYVNSHKKQLLKDITDQLNGNINGKLVIEEMEPGLLMGFPSISVGLKNVTLRDSMWQTHKQELIYAKNIYVSVNIFSILRGRQWITEVSINDGSIYLFVDNAGNSNLSSLYKTRAGSGKGQSRIHKFTLKNMRFVFDDKQRFKHYEFQIKKTSLKFRYHETGWTAKAGLDVFINDLAFNSNNGSFLKNKNIAAKVSVDFDQDRAILKIPEQAINIDDDELSIGGEFQMGAKPVAYMLNIKADEIAYTHATALLPANIAGKLNAVNFNKPITIGASISGRMQNEVPWVKVNCKVKDNALALPGTRIEECGFGCVYDNMRDHSLPPSDQNTLISLNKVTGNWSDIPFSCETVQVAGLSHPMVSCRLLSDIPLKKLNTLLGDKLMFNKGIARVSIAFTGGISANDTDAALSGTMAVQNAGFKYIPANLAVSNSNLALQFSGKDVYVQNARMQSGSNIVQVSGSVKNFLRLYFSNLPKMVVDCKLESPELDLNEFTSLFKKDTVKKQTEKMNIADIIRIGLRVGKLHYKTFTAKNVIANAALAGEKITLKITSLEHANGKITINASIGQKTKTFDVVADINHMNVKEFLRSFENFGQKTFTWQHFDGILSAKGTISGIVGDNGQIAPGSLNGTVSYKLQQVSLIDFEPLENIGRYVFRNRDLSNVQFRELNNRLEIKGDKLIISPMHIESSAITVNVDGVYGFKKGTDMNIDVPLRNPKKDELVENDEFRARRSMKGLVVHLKATDGEDGKVKIGWRMQGKKHHEGGEEAAANGKKHWWQRKK